MLTSILVFCALFVTEPLPTVAPQLHYTLRVTQENLTGVDVTLRIHDAPASITLAAHAHPEYDDKYWRYVADMRAEDGAGRSIVVARKDSVLWNLANAAGDVLIRYRVNFPREERPRAAWRPFLDSTGALVGGPHSFLYVVGGEKLPATITLDLPPGWRVATGLPGAPTSREFQAPDIHTLMESPMLVGRLSQWRFDIRQTPHRVFYWKLPNATPFDTTAFVDAIRRLAEQSVALFGEMPYREYTFLLQDGAYSGGLEHPNSVTLGAMSADLAKDPHATINEIAHEFVHTWNLMAIKPVEYREVDYRVQRPVSSLWFSEGLTIYYADLLLRRAGLSREDPTRVARLEGLMERYYAAPGNARFSAEAISRVEYNASPEALGDYTVSSHLTGELLGTMIDLFVRDRTDGKRTMDDVMRTMYTGFRQRGFTGADVQAAVTSTCGCVSDSIFNQHVRSGNAMDFNRYLAPLGLNAITTWAPAVNENGEPTRDLRVWGWVDDTGNLRLRLSDPESVWGKAGLRTGDKVVTINNREVRSWPELRTFLIGFAIGDSATIAVRRGDTDFTTKVMMRQLVRPNVRIEMLPDITARQRRLYEGWTAGR